MSGDKRYLKRLIATLNTYITNLKNYQISKNVTSALKKGPKEGAEAGSQVVSYKHSVVGPKIKDAVSKYVREYEKVTGVQELLSLQKSVVSAQERFLSVQERRRQAGQSLAELQRKMLELHTEMQNTSKADERYLKLVTEEHRALILEKAQRQSFEELEREERERFAEMSSAVKLSHESERAHAERSKYWYIVASIFGTILGVGGSTINNRIKMAEFKHMMEEQINRSTGMMVTAMGGETAMKNFDTLKFLPTEGINQLEGVLSQKIQELDEKINGLSTKYGRVVDSLHVQETLLKKHFVELRQLFVAAFQSSARSDERLAEMMTEVVHHDDKPSDSLIISNIPDPQVDRAAFVRLACTISFISILIGCALGRMI